MKILFVNSGDAGCWITDPVFAKITPRQAGPERWVKDFFRDLASLTLSARIITAESRSHKRGFLT